eukprot:TRINITY_DN2425_c0_g1_i1.p1 TRINITY_DN2425_c0_g1~~TRINITY_DN2425_c0_g1_i1.p1  ORF type:complete len:844 (-),score=111.43 TRINITY_DN2425_c0_g1_i1:33-2564(-)
MSQVCRWFLKGQCWDGDNCRQRHVGKGGAKGGEKASQKGSEKGGEKGAEKGGEKGGERGSEKGSEPKIKLQLRHPTEADEANVSEELTPRPKAMFRFLGRAVDNDVPDVDQNGEAMQAPAMLNQWGGVADDAAFNRTDGSQNHAAMQAPGALDLWGGAANATASNADGKGKGGSDSRGFWGGPADASFDAGFQGKGVEESSAFRWGVPANGVPSDMRFKGKGEEDPSGFRFGFPADGSQTDVGFQAGKGQSSGFQWGTQPDVAPSNVGSLGQGSDQTSAFSMRGQADAAPLDGMFSGKGMGDSGMFSGKGMGDSGMFSGKGIGDSPGFGWQGQPHAAPSDMGFQGKGACDASGFWGGGANNGMVASGPGFGGKGSGDSMSFDPSSMQSGAPHAGNEYNPFDAMSAQTGNFQQNSSFQGGNVEALAANHEAANPGGAVAEESADASQEQNSRKRRRSKFDQVFPEDVPQQAQAQGSGVGNSFDASGQMFQHQMGTQNMGQNQMGTQNMGQNQMGNQNFQQQQPTIWGTDQDHPPPPPNSDQTATSPPPPPAGEPPQNLNQSANGGFFVPDGIDPNQFMQLDPATQAAYAQYYQQFQGAEQQVLYDVQEGDVLEPPGKRARTEGMACKSFAHGMCTFGNGCPFSHDLEVIYSALHRGEFTLPEQGQRPPPFRKSRTLCRFFLQNRCQKGDDCPFSHDLNQIVNGTADGSITSADLQGPVRQKKNIPCRFFMTGGCRNEERCGFSHDPEVIAAAQGGHTSMPRMSEAMSARYKRELCRFFATGSCSRGATCIYAHGIQDIRDDSIRTALYMQQMGATATQVAAAAAAAPAPAPQPQSSRRSEENML